MENKSCASPRKVIEVKDSWVDIRGTMDTGAAGLVMPAEMFQRVKLDRTTATKKFVAANGEYRRLGCENHAIQVTFETTEMAQSSWCTPWTCGCALIKDSDHKQNCKTKDEVQQ